jgi:hypothetical protein
MEAALQQLQYQPLLVISKEFWVPTAEQMTELDRETNATRRGYLERRMMAEWAEEQAAQNAEIQANNDAVKKQRDEIIMKGNDMARRNTITKLMGQVMGDMMAESRRMIMKWSRTEPKDPKDRTSALMADTIDQAYQKYDWLFVFEAAMVTHLHADCTVDAMAILERQEIAINKLKTMKHEYGSLQTWLQRFDDAIEECKTLGATLTDDMQRTYLMHNLNEKIFEQTLVLWRGVLTRTNFPQTNDGLKAYITNEYSSQMTQTDRAKVIYGVISAHQKKRPELSLQTDEKDKDKCFLCDHKGHKMKKCWYYDATKTLEENKKEAAEKIKTKQEAKRKKDKMIDSEKELTKGGEPEKEKKNPGVQPQKGTYTQLPPKTEQVGLCKVREAFLYSEPCNMSGVRPGQVDFIYDSGTVSGVMGEREMNILSNVAEEDVLIETVSGERSLSKIYGDTIFGKTRILKGRKGSVLVSQYATKQLYQVINPDEDTFILKGWNHNPDTRGRVWYFVHDEERYKDKLLHCTVDVSEAQCFVISKEQKFYDPAKVPKSEEHETINDMVEVLRTKFQHASSNEMKRIHKMDTSIFSTIQDADIDHWHQERGQFCSGCVEGKLKEHSRVKSQKPLQSSMPGEVNIGDIMFVESKNDKKQPLMIHVDVCTKMITGVPLKNKSEEECTKVLLEVKTDYQMRGRKMKRLIFDREPGIVPIETQLKAHDIELILKAAGQKVGLAEVSIRLVHKKARATKASVRANFGCIPPNHMDLCMDSISVLNRIPKQGQIMNPYELFTGRKVDFIRDFRAEWGEPGRNWRPQGLSYSIKKICLPPSFRSCESTRMGVGSIKRH